jgi:hypothetical protein
MPLYKGVSELSLALLFYALHADPHTTTTTHLSQNEISESLLPEGLIERFPPGSPTLFNYIEWVV